MVSNKKNSKTLLTGWIICTLAALFFCYEYILRIEPSFMMPELMQEFQVNATQIGILAATFYFFYVPVQIVIGLLFDLYGPRKTLTFAVALCTIGSYIFGIAHTLPIATIGRLFIGLGGAFAFVGVLKLATVWLPHRFFAFFVGLATTLGMLGAILGNITLSYFVHNIGWRQTVTFGTIIGLILTPLIWFIVKDKPHIEPSKPHIDKTKPKYLETFKEFLKILKHPQMWLNGFIGCILYLSLTLFAELWGPSFLSAVYHLSQQNAATANSMVFLGWLIGGPLIGYASDITYSRRIPIFLGCLLSALSIALVIYFPQMDVDLLYLLLLLFGIFSSSEVLCFAISRENNPKSLVATASAFTNALIMLGGIVFQPLIGKILDLLWLGQTLNSIRVYSAANYQYALTILPILLFLGFVLTFWLRESVTKNENKK